MTAKIAFDLHPQLQRDCIVLGHWDLSILLLMNDARYPWFLLVPRRPGVREIHELTPADQMALARESSALSAGLARVFAADKMNVAALGNVVEQLHVHHVVRYKTDAAWPAPVWGLGQRQAYTAEQLSGTLVRLRSVLMPDFACTEWPV